MADFAYAVMRQALTTSVETQDFTTTDFGGGTPTFAMVICTYATVDGTAHADAGMSVGWTDGTTEKCLHGNAEDGQGTTDTIRRAADTLLHIDGPGDAIADCVATLDSFITNGITLNVTDAPAEAYLLTVVLFGGTDFDSDVGEITHGTQDTLRAVTAPGFLPSALMFLNLSDAWTAVNATGTYDLGIAVNDDTPTQFFQEYWSLNGQATSSVFGRSTNTSVGFLRTVNDLMEVYSFDSSGFTTVAREGGSAVRELAYAALQFGGTLKTRLIGINSPTSTGSFSVTGLGMRPVFLMMQCGLLIDRYLSHSDSTTGSLALSVMTESAQFCNAFADEDNVGTTNCESVSDNAAVYLNADDGTSLFRATLTSMDADGFTLNFSAVDTTVRKWWVLAVGYPPAPRLINGGPIR